jgi:hypothetical protein
MRFPDLSRIVAAAFVLLVVSAAAYPGDDWIFYKPGPDLVAKDVGDCIMSPNATPTFDSKAQMTKDPRIIEAYQRYILACMGAKGYVLRPPKP